MTKDAAILAGAIRAAVRPEAVDDILRRAAELEDDEPSAGAVDSWFDGLRDTRPHYFTPNQGAGASGSARRLSGEGLVEFGSRLSDVTDEQLKVLAYRDDT